MSKGRNASKKVGNHWCKAYKDVEDGDQRCGCTEHLPGLRKSGKTFWKIFFILLQIWQISIFITFLKKMKQQKLSLLITVLVKCMQQ